MAERTLTALFRFGLGPRPGEVEAGPLGPDTVAAQLRAPAGARVPGRSTREIRERWRPLQIAVREARRAANARSAGASANTMALEGALANMRILNRTTTMEEVGARFEKGVFTAAPFVERLVLFWSNLFAINRQREPRLRFLAGAFEREAIRPNVLKSFADLLIAATTHPAMLIYLDNDTSFGPGSAQAKRHGFHRLNENLAREVLELHSVGAEGGYGLPDIKALALVLTGWTGAFHPREWDEPFEPWLHDGDRRTVMGRTYPADGPDQLKAVLRDLALHPATARRLARRMALHFVGEAASADLIGALARTYQRTGGDLSAMAGTLATHADAWSPPPAKTVPPYDLVVSCGRALKTLFRPRFVVRATRDLGQPVFTPPSPAGWPEGDDAFLSGDALLERADFASLVGRWHAGGHDPRRLAESLFAGQLDPFVAEAIARAEDRRQGLALLFMSPPYQRR